MWDPMKHKRYGTLFNTNRLLSKFMGDCKQKHYEIYGTPCHATHAMGHSVTQTRHKIWNFFWTKTFLDMANP
jgi:hypothetical protein